MQEPRTPNNHRQKIGLYGSGDQSDLPWLSLSPQRNPGRLLCGVSVLLGKAPNLPSAPVRLPVEWGGRGLAPGLGSQARVWRLSGGGQIRGRTESAPTLTLGGRASECTETPMSTFKNNISFIKYSRTDPEVGFIQENNTRGFFLNLFFPTG